MKTQIKTNKLKRFFQKNITGYLFIAPFFIFFLIFVIFPVLISFGLSFSSYDMINSPKFIGINNFRELILNDDVFIISLKNTLIFAVIAGPIGFFGSFIMAWLINNIRRQSLRNFLSLAFYIDTYGPNIKKMFKAEPDAEYACTAPDNNIYMLPMVDTSNPVRRFMNVMYINKKWLKNLGLSKPKTTEEFASVLRAFKTGDPNGNGKADEIPWVMPYFDPQLLGAFGISAYHNMYYVDNSDKVQYAAVQNEYREAVIYYRNLYKEGLIDKNTFLTSQVDANKVISQVANQSVETVGCFMTTDSTLVMDGDRAYNDYEVLGPLKGPNGACTYTNQVLEDMWPDWFLVTKACKYPEIAVRLADYFYSTEGTYTAMYGPQGQGWKVNKEGKVVLRSSKTGNWMYKFTPGHVLPHYASANFTATLVEPTPTTSAEKAYAKSYEDRIKLYTPVAAKKVFPQLSYTDDENSRISTLTETVSSYMQKSTTSFLNGSQSIESYWDGYVANLKKIGLNDLLEIQNAAYQRYLKYKKGQ